MSFVIPHAQNLPMVQAAVGSLSNLAKPADWSSEIVIIDNGSPDELARSPQLAGCRIERLERNAGFARAVNRGVDLSDGDWIVVMNDDVELDPNWLEEVRKALEANPGAWFACGKTLAHSDRGRIDGAGDAICRGGVSWRLGHGRTDGPAFTSPRTVFFPSATATLFRRTFFDKIGRFDEIYFAYLEDVDLGLRAALADLPGIYVPAALAYHHGSSTGGVWSSQAVRWITSHQIVLLSKFYPLRLWLRFGWNILVAQLLWAGLAAARGHAGAWTRGMARGVLLALRRGRERQTLRVAAERLPQVLADSEAELAHFQQTTGFDSFWKWYFRLTGGSGTAK